jgi:competence protein ComEC
MALPTIPVLSASLAWLVEHTTIIMTKTLAFIEHAPFGSIEKIWLNYAELILLYALLAAVLISCLTKTKIWFKLSFGLLLIFMAVSSITRLAIAGENTIGFFSISKHPALVVKHGSKAVVLTDLSTHDKSYSYSIAPMLDSCRITETNIVDMKSNINNAFMVKNGSLIQTGEQRILIINKILGKKLFPQKLNVDYIYITGSPAVNLQYLTENYTFKMVIAGNNNSARLLKSLDNEAVVKQVPFYNLKRNKAFVTSSNIN